MSPEQLLLTLLILLRRSGSIKFSHKEIGAVVREINEGVLGKGKLGVRLYVALAKDDKGNFKIDPESGDIEPDLTQPIIVSHIYIKDPETLSNIVPGATVQ